MSEDINKKKQSVPKTRFTIKEFLRFFAIIFTLQCIKDV